MKISAVIMVQNLVKTPRQILRGSSASALKSAAFPTVEIFKNSADRKS